MTSCNDLSVRIRIVTKITKSPNVEPLLIFSINSANHSQAWQKMNEQTVACTVDADSRGIQTKKDFEPVLRIRIRRIRMFLGLLDPDLLFWGTILLSSSKNSKKNLDSYCFEILFDILSLKNNVNHTVNVPTFKSNKQKNFFYKLVFCWRLEGQNSRIRIH